MRTFIIHSKSFINNCTTGIQINILRRYWNNWIDGLKTKFVSQKCLQNSFAKSISTFANTASKQSLALVLGSG